MGRDHTWNRESLDIFLMETDEGRCFLIHFFSSLCFGRYRSQKSHDDFLPANFGIHHVQTAATTAT